MSESIYHTNKYEGIPCKKCNSTLKYVRKNLCVNCFKLSQKKYDQSPKGVAAQQRYDQSRKTRKLWYSRTPKGKIAIRKSKYNLTQFEYEQFLFNQKGNCAICPKQLNNSTRDTVPHVDHNHKTGKVRGLLCGACNKAIGLLQDNPQTCMNAATYLKS